MGTDRVAGQNSLTRSLAVERPWWARIDRSEQYGGERWGPVGKPLLGVRPEGRGGSMQVVHVPRWSRLLSLAPLALLVVSACSQGPVTYTGSQPRTPIEKIPSGGEMKNFQLVGQNQLLDPKFNLPRGMGGGITAIRDCLYAGSSIAYQPTLILDMKDLTKPTVVGEVPGIAGKGMGIEAIEAVADLNLLVNTARNSKGWTEAPP